MSHVCLVPDIRSLISVQLVRAQGAQGAIKVPPSDTFDAQTVPAVPHDPQLPYLQHAKATDSTLVVVVVVRYNSAITGEPGSSISPDDRTSIHARHMPPFLIGPTRESISSTEKSFLAQPDLDPDFDRVRPRNLIGRVEG